MADAIFIKKDGKVGKCDSRCWCAADIKCSCTCGGANHSKGVEKVMAEAVKKVNEQRNKKQDNGDGLVGQLPLL